MKVYYDKNLEPKDERTHPWQPSPCGRYYDFKKSPELVPQVLEEFMPFDHHKAVRVFYDLLGWLNGPDSALESNDCAFRGPGPNDDDKWPKGLVCSGRLMVFFRRLTLNTLEEYLAPLMQGLRHYLEQLDPGLEFGAVAISRAPVRYIEIPAGKRQTGSEVLLTFWAWGDDEEETMDNLRRVFCALHECFKLVSRDITAAAG